MLRYYGLQLKRVRTNPENDYKFAMFSFNSASGNAIAIDGVECDIVAESSTEIRCVTNAHTGPGKYLVEVTVPGKGVASVVS